MGEILLGKKYLEIERKFIVDKELQRPQMFFHLIRQGYLNRDPDRTVRVRKSVLCRFDATGQVEPSAGSESSYISLKGRNNGAVRTEIEQRIPTKKADAMLGLCDGLVIVKHRYTVYVHNDLWEVDFFQDDLKGLKLAEIELNSKDQEFEKPPWVTTEVTEDRDFYNSSLSTGLVAKLRASGVVA